MNKLAGRNRARTEHEAALWAKYDAAVATAQADYIREIAPARARLEAAITRARAELGGPVRWPFLA